MTTGILYIVATPIGNLNDITLRAIEVLKQVDVIAAEDTRHSKKLLDHYGIDTRLMAVHDHNEQDRIEVLMQFLQDGKSVALISDAGTPLISDPGFRIVRAMQKVGLGVVSIPGPCAAVAALSIAGLPTDRFLFVGFLPPKQQARRSALEKVLTESATLVFYESPKRIADCVADVIEVMGAERVISVAKEITKAFETVKTGAAAEVLDWLLEDDHHRRGEFVLLVQGAETEAPGDTVVEPSALRAVQLANEYMPMKKACALVSGLTGVPKNALYEAALLQNKG
ncbi:16S rRNA (cytidine(1402)-2'-O)-methyltransferase [Ketobacter alkanivorans]|uniref:Ribosomal RNA small subunit methyltransferase I n=1 Tax=Ketobacter alkanivorans TaxID=1917421 RepID=A0A2K9LRJ9_9GAMM|nr:16S rRNA (cytidine(1402)-2'-O)-methyltransferase [Ketobacter alkanivorans]